MKTIRNRVISSLFFVALLLAAMPLFAIFHQIPPPPMNPPGGGENVCYTVECGFCGEPDPRNGFQDCKYDYFDGACACTYEKGVCTPYGRCTTTYWDWFGAQSQPSR